MVNHELKPLVESLYDFDLTAALAIFDLLPPSDWRWQGLHRLIGCMVYSINHPAWSNERRWDEFRRQLLEMFWPELAADKTPGALLQRMERHLRPQTEAAEAEKMTPAGQPSNAALSIDPILSNISEQVRRIREQRQRDTIVITADELRAGAEEFAAGRVSADEYRRGKRLHSEGLKRLEGDDIG